MRKITCALLFLSLALIAVGIWQGQAKQTASRAQRICLECVGFD